MTDAKIDGKYNGYATKRLEEIENGTANLYKFIVKKGRKYLKIINQQYDDMGVIRNISVQRRFSTRIH